MLHRIDRTPAVIRAMLAYLDSWLLKPDDDDGDGDDDTGEIVAPALSLCRSCCCCCCCIVVDCELQKQ